MIDPFKISESLPTVGTAGSVRLKTDRAVYTEYAEQCKREGLTVSEALANLMRESTKYCNSMNRIIAISVFSMLALGMSIVPTSVCAQADAYSKGYKDATCDAVSCNGHGYDPSCPGDHSKEYCANYSDGYAAGWDASTNANSNSNSNSQGAAIGGNNINGNNNTINQLQSQQEQSGNGNSDNGGNGHNGGQLSQCKAFCVQ